MKFRDHCRQAVVDRLNELGLPDTYRTNLAVDKFLNEGWVLVVFHRKGLTACHSFYPGRRIKPPWKL